MILKSTSRVINRDPVPLPDLFIDLEEFWRFVDELDLIPRFMVTRAMLAKWSADFHANVDAVCLESDRRDIARAFIRHYSSRNRQRVPKVDLDQLELF